MYNNIIRGNHILFLLFVLTENITTLRYGTRSCYYLLEAASYRITSLFEMLLKKKGKNSERGKKNPRRRSKTRVHTLLGGNEFAIRVDNAKPHYHYILR